ncbi:MAG: hypothetical protein M3037_13190, partial [Gemmatimonadota bacterium]|nr:hypothetical protein [Gemmatimonadota bacterium]MDQ6872939.1 hypothetical protein [Gemmatimonadota bacterium]
MRNRWGRVEVGRSLTMAIPAVAALAMTACLTDPVEWGDVAYRRSQLGDPDTRSGRLSANLPSVSGSVDHCVRSIRTASAGPDLFRIWWTAKSDSSVVLSMQHSPDGGARWDPP